MTPLVVGGVTVMLAVAAGPILTEVIGDRGMGVVEPPRVSRNFGEKVFCVLYVWYSVVDDVLQLTVCGEELSSQSIAQLSGEPEVTATEKGRLSPTDAVHCPERQEATLVKLKVPFRGSTLVIVTMRSLLVALPWRAMQLLIVT